MMNTNMNAMNNMNTNLGPNAPWVNKFKTKYMETASGANNNTFTQDERIWKPTYDPATGGVATVRFLPHRNAEELPFVEVISHWFEANGTRYAEKSLATLQKPDPVSELNSRLWNSGNDADKDQAKAQKRNKKYYANVLVINDPLKPENNGKVFIYEFGYSIFRTLQDSMFPQVHGIKPINPFDLDAGHNFNIYITMKKFNNRAVPNYEKSAFDPNTTTIENKQAIMSQTYDLSEFVDPSKFKSYDELCEKLVTVLGYTTGASNNIPVLSNSNSVPKPVSVQPVQQVESTPTVTTTSKTVSTITPDDDDEEVAKMKAILAELDG